MSCRQNEIECRDCRCACHCHHASDERRNEEGIGFGGVVFWGLLLFLVLSAESESSAARRTSAAPPRLPPKRTSWDCDFAHG